jgi:hypothetical protein
MKRRNLLTLLFGDINALLAWNLENGVNKPRSEFGRVKWRLIILYICILHLVCKVTSPGRCLLQNVRKIYG